MNFRAVLVMILFLAGCGSTIELPEKYRPLQYVTESKTLGLGVSARTIGDTMYVSDLDGWLEDHQAPLDAGVYNHERVHAIQQREFTTGRWAWIAKYLWDPKFMWEAEQLAYWSEIVYLRSMGVLIVVDSWAENLAGYLAAQGPMISESDAKAWLQSVLNGQWNPAPADAAKFKPVY